MTALLEVEDLRVRFDTEDGVVHAVDGISYSVEVGRTLGIVGESGSGKSVEALTIMGLTRGRRTAIEGAARLEGRDLIAASDDDLRAVRGNDVAMIFQDPLSSLHPYFRVGWQIVEAIRAHRDVSKAAARDRTIELLGLVGIPDPSHRVDDFPHEFSGGMRQRAMIAMALANDPKLLIADEPTTALDVTVQAQILELMGRLQRELGMAIIIITHDLGVVAETADEIAVMYAGRIVERAPTAAMFSAPRHPYTWGLLRSIPRLDVPREAELVPIAGRPPSLIRRPSGCAFHPRCPYALPSHAATVPPLEEVEGDPGHHVACLLPEAVRAALDERLRGGATPEEARAAAGVDALERGAGVVTPAMAGEPLVEVRDLVKHFPIRRGVVFQRQIGAVRAVDGVSFDVLRGETLGLVGETGCGKSTTARLITRLLDPTSGSIRFDGRDIATVGRRELGPLRREVQMIFQDPYSSLNPRKTIGAIIAEPFAIHKLLPGAGERRTRVQELMERVGLNPEHYNRFPHEFSGGQRQRIGVARALALDPRLIIADEPVSALDVSIQAQILNLLRDLQRDLGLTIVFIAHDLSVVRHMCDRVAVMYLGKIVELASGDELYRAPRHPYTGALLAAVPVPRPTGRARRRELLPGDVPSPADPPAACRFHTRCWKAEARCAEEEPRLESRAGGDDLTACHFPLTAEEVAERVPELARRASGAAAQAAGAPGEAEPSGEAEASSGSSSST